MFIFSDVYLDLLKFCIVCVDIRGYVYVCGCYVDLDEPPPCSLFTVCVYGGEARCIWCFRFLCEFFFCIVMMFACC